MQTELFAGVSGRTLPASKRSLAGPTLETILADRVRVRKMLDGPQVGDFVREANGGGLRRVAALLLGGVRLASRPGSYHLDVCGRGVRSPKWPQAGISDPVPYATFEQSEERLRGKFWIFTPGSGQMATTDVVLTCSVWKQVGSSV